MLEDLKKAVNESIEKDYEAMLELARIASGDGIFIAVTGNGETDRGYEHVPYIKVFTSERPYVKGTSRIIKDGVHEVRILIDKEPRYIIHNKDKKDSDYELSRKEREALDNLLSDEDNWKKAVTMIHEKIKTSPKYKGGELPFYEKPDFMNIKPAK